MIPSAGTTCCSIIPTVGQICGTLHGGLALQKEVLQEKLVQNGRLHPGWIVSEREIGQCEESLERPEFRQLKDGRKLNG